MQALAELLASELQVEKWAQLRQLDFDQAVRPVLKAAAVLPGVIETLAVAVSPGAYKGRRGASGRDRCFPLLGRSEHNGKKPL